MATSAKALPNTTSPEACLFLPNIRKAPMSNEIIVRKVWLHQPRKAPNVENLQKICRDRSLTLFGRGGTALSCKKDFVDIWASLKAFLCPR